jgi:hypothetical protein
MILEAVRHRLSQIDVGRLRQHKDVQKIPRFNGSGDTLLGSIFHDNGFQEAFATSSLSKPERAAISRIVHENYYFPTETQDSEELALTIDIVRGLSDAELRKLQFGVRRSHLGEKGVAILRALVGENKD